MKRMVKRRSKSVLRCLLSLIVNFVVGFLLASLVWSIIVKPYGHYLSLLNSHLPGALFSLIIAIFYASFVKLRANIVLFIPSMLGTAAQNYIIVVLFVNLSRGPIYSITINAVESVRVIGCTLSVTFELAKERAKLILSPILQILQDDTNVDFRKIQMELGNIQKVISKITQLNQSQTVTSTPRIERKIELKPLNITNTAMKHIEQMNLSASDLASLTEQLLQNASLELDATNFGVKVGLDAAELEDLVYAGTKIKMDKFNLTDIMYQNCLDIFRSAKSGCYDAAEDIRQSCVDTIGPYLAAVWCTPVTLSLGAICPWILDELVNENSLCNQFVQSMSGVQVSGKVIDINSMYKNLTQQVASLGENLRTNETDEAKRVSNRRLEFTVTLNEKVRNVFLKTRDLLDFITDKYRLRRAIFDAFSLIYDLFTTFTFVTISVQACKYHRNYVKNIQHDNHYITRQFVEYDKRRKLSGKSSVLPLKKDESETYIATFTCRRRTEEERKTQRSSCVGAVFLIIFSLSVLYMDYLFYSILVSVHEHAYVRYRQLGHHELEVKVIGDGSIARLVRRLTSKLSSVYDLNQLTSTKRCLPNAQATGYQSYIAYVLLILTYLSIDQVSIYAMRLRRVTCAFFYPEKEALRIEYLHRYLRYQRKRNEELGLTSYIDDVTDEEEASEIYTIKDALSHLKNCVRDSICCKSCRKLFSKESKK